MSKRFRIAFSFAGDKRKFVEEVADILASRFGEDGILYDKYHQAEFARGDLAFHLPALYRDEADLVVAVLCNDYEKKEWCGLEWNAIYALIKKRQHSEVMLCRFDQVEGKGLYDLAGFVDLDDKDPSNVAHLILERLALNEGHSRDYYTSDAEGGPTKRFAARRPLVSQTLDTNAAPHENAARPAPSEDSGGRGLAIVLLSIGALATAVVSAIGRLVPVPTLASTGFSSALIANVGVPVLTTACSTAVALVGRGMRWDYRFLVVAGCASVLAQRILLFVSFSTIGFTLLGAHAAAVLRLIGYGIWAAAFARHGIQLSLCTSGLMVPYVAATSALVSFRWKSVASANVAVSALGTVETFMVAMTSWMALAAWLRCKFRSLRWAALGAGTLLAAHSLAAVSPFGVGQVPSALLYDIAVWLIAFSVGKDGPTDR